MSTRRNSNGFLAVRQNDALMEFENFKRKYLLVNKHITKLNSTLSVRVEELNAQVATLTAENVRLRASEISLATQLKKEKKRNKLIFHQAEHAVGSLMEHLTGMRTTLGLATPNAMPASPSPPLKGNPLTSPVQPPRDVVRLARPPADVITQIRESDEDETDNDASPTRGYSSRLPSSRLPLSKFTPRTPHQGLPRDVDLISVTKRKPGRRNSSLLMIDNGTVTPITPGERVHSPVNGPLRRSRRRSLETRRDSLEEEEMEVERAIQGNLDIDGDGEAKAVGRPSNPIEKQMMLPIPPQDAMESKEKPMKVTLIVRGHNENQAVSERDSSESSTKEKERRRFGIKDVTNSPRRTPDFFEDKTSACAHTMTMHTEVPASSLQLEGKTSIVAAAAVNASASNLSASSALSETVETMTGRERRNRKSVNYAEPKLNTKMRKPDPLPDAEKPRQTTATTRRRKSVPASHVVPASDEDGDADVETGALIRSAENRRKTIHNASTSSRIPTGVPRASFSVDALGAWGDETRRQTAEV